MNAPAAAVITAPDLRDRLDAVTPPRLIDVRTPAEFETAHIAGSFNVPLDVLDGRTAEVASYLEHDPEVVLVCRSGQRSAKADQLLRNAGTTQGRVLERGILDWEGRGFELERGVARWDLERQVRLVAGSLALASVLGSVVVPQAKWLAAAVGGGLTFAALTDTCAMAGALAKLPYNRPARTDADHTLSALGRSTVATP
jgi:rhodanese-related sulfurtransferase